MSGQARAVSYHQEHRDENNRKYREKYAAQRHEEITYLVWSPGLKLIKIGITTGLRMRLKALRTGCPDIYLIGTLPCGRPLEKHLHIAFASQSAGGEWFDLGPDVIQAALNIIQKVMIFSAA